MKMSANMTEALLALSKGSAYEVKAPTKTSVSALEKRGLITLGEDGQARLTREGKEWVAMISG